MIGKAQYISTICTIIELAEYTFMLDCEFIPTIDPQNPTLNYIHRSIPSFDQVDFSKIDFILISSYRTGQSLPYITEYTSFRGLVFSTQPTIEFLSLVCNEYVEYVEKENRTRPKELLDLPYIKHDVECAMSKIKPLFYNHPQVRKYN